MTTDPRLAVSSFSLREQLGPLRFAFRDATGAERAVTMDNPQLLPISDFPRRAADELGVDAVETVGFHFAGLDDPEIGRFEKGLADAGVRLLNICFDTGDLLDPDADRRAADLVELKAWVRRFAAMGSEFVRVNPGSPASPWGGEQAPGHLADGLAELGAFARSEGTRLLVENHSGPSSRAPWVHALLEQVGQEHCGLLLDLGNLEPLMSSLRAVTRGHSDPAAADLAVLLADVDLDPLYEAVGSLAPRAELVSVKTNWVADDGSVGAVDLHRALRVLAEHGYSGAFSVEYEGWGGDPWTKTRRVVDVSREAFAASQA